MSSFEASTGNLQGIQGGVGKICPYLPGVRLIKVPMLDQEDVSISYAIIIKHFRQTIYAMKQ